MVVFCRWSRIQHGGEKDFLPIDKEGAKKISKKIDRQLSNMEKNLLLSPPVPPSSSPPHLLTSSPPLLLTSSHPHLLTSYPPHLFTSSPPHLLSSCMLSFLLLASPNLASLNLTYLKMAL